VEPLLLTVSTATRLASIAVTRGESLLGEVALDPPGTQSDFLLPVIADLLTRLELKLEEFDCFAAVHGPGAFTGLRVGIATIKGLALALNKPVIGVSSLQSLAMQVPDVAAQVYTLIDARKKEVYAGCYNWESGLPHPVCAERVIDPQQLLSEISGEALFVGDGSIAYRTLIVRQLGSRARFAPSSANMLRAGSAAMLALVKFEADELLSAASLNPVYIRPSDAELNKRETAPDGAIEG